MIIPLFEKYACCTVWVCVELRTCPDRLVIETWQISSDRGVFFGCGLLQRVKDSSESFLCVVLCVLHPSKTNQLIVKQISFNTLVINGPL